MALLTPIKHSSKGLPKQQRLVKVVGVYCAIGYVVVQVLFLGVWCKPIQQYWRVPVINCTFRQSSTDRSHRPSAQSPKTHDRLLIGILPNSPMCIILSPSHHRRRFQYLLGLDDVSFTTTLTDQGTTAAEKVCSSIPTFSIPSSH